MKKVELRTHLLLYIILFAIVSYMTMAFLVSFFTRDFLENIIYDKTLDILKIIEDETQHYLAHPKQELVHVKNALNRNMDSGFINAAFDMFTYVHHIDILDHNGTIIRTLPENTNRVGLDYSKNMVYKSIHESSKDYLLGQMLYDSYIEAPTVYMSLKYNEGYIAGYLNLEHFSELLEQMNLESGQMSIIDDFGTYISHTSHEKVSQRAVDPYAKKIQMGEIQPKAFIKYEDREVSLLYRQIEGTQWYILYYQSLDSINGPVFKIIMTIIMIMVIILTGFILVISRIMKRFGKSLNQLDEATQMIADGNYNITDMSFSYQEFDQLFLRMKSMSHEVETREEEITALNKEVEENYFTTIELLAKAIDAKDHYTGNHSMRVRDYAVMLALELQLSENEMRELRFGAVLHDIGKIGIPEQLLNKPGKLTDEEFSLIRSHSQAGYNIVEELPGMKQAKQIILYHHERFDGKGYPLGLKGKEIPLLARIVTIADSFDAMVSERPYRSYHMSYKDGFEELRKNAGTQFDPDFVELFIQKVMSQGLD